MFNFTTSTKGRRQTLPTDPASQALAGQGQEPVPGICLMQGYCSMREDAMGCLRRGKGDLTKDGFFEKKTCPGRRVVV